MFVCEKKRGKATRVFSSINVPVDIKTRNGHCKRTTQLERCVGLHVEIMGSGEQQWGLCGADDYSSCGFWEVQLLDSRCMKSIFHSRGTRCETQ